MVLAVSCFILADIQDPLVEKSGAGNPTVDLTGEEEGSNVTAGSVPEVAQGQAEATPTQQQEVRTETVPTQKQEVRTEATPTQKQEVQTEATPTQKQEVETEATPTQKQEVRTEATPTQHQQESREQEQTDAACKELPSQEEMEKVALDIGRGPRGGG